MAKQYGGFGEIFAYNQHKSEIMEGDGIIFLKVRCVRLKGSQYNNILLFIQGYY